MRLGTHSTEREEQAEQDRQSHFFPPNLFILNPYPEGEQTKKATINGRAERGEGATASGLALLEDGDRLTASCRNTISRWVGARVLVHTVCVWIL